MRSRLFIWMYFLSIMSISSSETTKNQWVEEGQNKLLFMVGTWKTEGTQFWGNGVWVKHKGIVECKLLKDGLTLERTFWATFDNGASLAGKSLMIYDPKKKVWSSKWIPTLGKWDVGISIGKMEDSTYVEVARGSDQSGKFVSKTKAFDISKDSYSVSTDIIYDSGIISKNNWNIKFTRIKKLGDQANRSNTKKTMTFLNGNWVADGKLQLPDGSLVDHKCYVEAYTDKDGVIKREFWGAMDIGVPIRGVSTYKSQNDIQWNGQWIPKSGAPSPISKVVHSENEFIESYEQNTPFGKVNVITRYYDISTNEYKIISDVIGQNGEFYKGAWTAHFKKIE